MIKSMTGFGKASCNYKEKTIVVEIRTLNSKTLDFGIRMPAAYRPYELDIRNMINQGLLRGKVELSIGFENGSQSAPISLNKALLEQYYNELSELSRSLGIPQSPDLLPALLRLPDVMAQPAMEADAGEWEYVQQTIIDAMALVNAFRESEGQHLHQDMIARIQLIEGLLGAIEPLEQNRLDALKNKLLKGLNELGESVKPDPNRFEQELIFYLEKLDISEEKVRLEKHLSYFMETIMEPESAGKKLGFIAQEIGREINTIGSKANDAAIQKLVVQMKDELEKIKEQLMNIL
jgi:uncharacterized protein (TIGR00255 family)